MLVLYALLGIAAFILYIVIVVKFFQMASDIRTIKNIQLRSLPIPPTERASNGERIADSEEVTGKIGLITYSSIGNNVEFSDGIKGEILRYSGFSECSVIDDGYEYLYNDIYYAIEALYSHKTTNTFPDKGLYEKRQFKGTK